MYAYNFAIDVYGNGVFNETHRMWIESMSRNCETNIFRASKNDLKLLRMPYLAETISDLIGKFEGMYHGTKFGAHYASNDAINYVIEPAHLTREQFLDVCFMTETRRMLRGHKQVFIPLFDYINNAERQESRHLDYFDNGTHVGFVAVQPIRSGTEMRWDYASRRVAPDFIFLTWQYVTEATDVLFEEDQRHLHEIEAEDSSSGSRYEKISRSLAYIDSVLVDLSVSDEEGGQPTGANLTDLQALFVSLRLHRKRILTEQRKRLRRMFMFEKMWSLGRLVTRRGSNQP